MTVSETIAELRELDLEREAERHEDCRSCNSTMETPFGLEPTPVCNLCAHSIITEKLPSLLSALDSMQRRLEHAEKAALLLRELAHEIESGGANLFATKATEAAYDEWLAADEALTSERKGEG